LSVAVFGRRAVHEVADLADAVGRVHPDALLVDVNCWGALSAAEAGDLPWACFSPYTPPLRSPGVPPFGLGLKPLSSALGRLRDAAVQTTVVGCRSRGIYGRWAHPCTTASKSTGACRSCHCEPEWQL
jgi:hypothetical protein